MLNVHNNLFVIPFIGKLYRYSNLFIKCILFSLKTNYIQFFQLALHRIKPKLIIKNFQKSSADSKLPLISQLKSTNITHFFIHAHSFLFTVHRCTHWVQCQPPELSKMLKYIKVLTCKTKIVRRYISQRYYLCCRSSWWRLYLSKFTKLKSKQRFHQKFLLFLPPLPFIFHEKLFAPLSLSLSLYYLNEQMFQTNDTRDNKQFYHYKGSKMVVRDAKNLFVYSILYSKSIIVSQSLS